MPCLRIAHEDGRTEWMYESADINRYLEQRFGGRERNLAVTRRLGFP